MQGRKQKGRRKEEAEERAEQENIEVTGEISPRKLKSPCQILNVGVGLGSSQHQLQGRGFERGQATAGSLDKAALLGRNPTNSCSSLFPRWLWGRGPWQAPGWRYELPGAALSVAKGHSAAPLATARGSDRGLSALEGGRAGGTGAVSASTSTQGRGLRLHLFFFLHWMLLKGGVCPAQTVCSPPEESFVLPARFHFVLTATL